MAVFSYKAIALPTRGQRVVSSQLVQGTILADSPRTAREILRGRGLRIDNITEVRGAAKANSQARLSRRHEAKVVGFISELSTLLSAGIPLLGAIDSISKQHRGAFNKSLLVLRDRVASGASLADAMRQQPEVFDPLCVSMVEVGERAGTLDDVLTQVARYKRRLNELKSTVGNALIYPAIVLTAAAAVTIFLMTFVVPKLLDTLVSADRPIPLATRIVKAASDALTGYWWLLLLVVCVVLVSLVAIIRRPGTRRTLHGLMLRLPLLGDLIRKQAISRIAITVAILTRSGVEFIQAVRIAQRSTANLALRDALTQIEQAVQAGRDLAPALEATGLFPNAVVQLFAVGQESGKLDQMLERLATDYDLQVHYSLQRLIALIEPALILLLAGVVGFVVLSIILPYMEAGNVV